MISINKIKHLTWFIYQSIDEISKILSRKFNLDIYLPGINSLGISTQISSKYIYISSGPNRKYEYEKNILFFKHATLKETNSFSYIANIVIQAFKELGKDNIQIYIDKENNI